MLTIQAAKDQIKDTVEAYLQKDDAGMYVIDPSRQRPIFLVGAPGIGKTAIIEQIAQELQIGVVSYSMTHHTRQSALGLPRIVHREFDGLEYEASEYTMSEIVSAVYDYMEKSGTDRGILFLDEINCVSETLYPSMLQFLQFKTFGRHRVPHDWVIVCAGNPPEYNKSVHEFDIVTLDRLREIDVEPDYPTFKRYAAEKGLHPAVTTFLEAKPDCFYKVESKPGGGKSFVTARAWEDLAEVISLYEKMGKKVNRELFEQFLRDDEIADHFAVYYSLFEKYRSDYQVTRILGGTADNAVSDRAKSAQFDERVALLGLLIDALARECAGALEQEELVVGLRDMLRAAKPKLLDGATVEDAIVVPLREREASLARKVAANTAKTSYRRRENLVIRKLKDIVGACELARTEQGAAAFETVNGAYRDEVAKIKPAVDEAGSKMDNVFGFIDRCWGGGREMLVFMAELTTREATTQFVAHYGNERYYRHNDSLQVDATRKDLAARLKELGDFDVEIGTIYEGVDGNALDLGSGVGLSVGGGIPKGMKPGGPFGFATGGTNVGEQAADASSADAAAPAGAAGRELTIDEHYSRDFEWGFASMSRMTLPDLKGQRVLDVCCRRGKGAYKISARVGNEGSVVGVDWSADYIREADAGKERAWRDSHLAGNNMEFHVAYPEDLMAAGLGNNSVDAVYINNVMTLLYDPAQALAEFFRVLKPGGLLICETIFSDVERDEAVVDAARSIGNSIQAGRTQGEFFGMLAAAGFGVPEVVDSFEVDASTGFKFSRKVETVPSDEQVTFSAVALNVRKPQ